MGLEPMADWQLLILQATWGIWLIKITTFVLGKKKDFAALNTKFVRMKAHLPLIYWLWAEIQPWHFQQKMNCGNLIDTSNRYCGQALADAKATLDNLEICDCTAPFVVGIKTNNIIDGILGDLTADPIVADP